MVRENGGAGSLVGISATATNWFIAEQVLDTDAPLIAAAPDLLAACKMVIAGRKKDTYDYRHALDLMVLAIAKAECTTP